jgi:RNA polymerase sigma factor (TIGR02999 family)
VGVEGKTGSGGSSDEMIAALYADLCRIAHRERWSAGRPNTWQTTAIVHEAYLKLYRQEAWESREHFLGTAATTMRHILVDAARARMAAKRGGGEGRLPLEAARDVAIEDLEDREVVRLGDALRDLALLDAQLARLVDCRFFVGLSEVETAALLGITERTVRRWWIRARAWIHRELAAAD